MGARSHLINYGARAGTRYASRASRYLRQGIGGVNLEKVLTLAAIGGALYLGWKVYKAISAVGDFAGDAARVGQAVTNAIGGALGRGLYTLFNWGDPEYSGVSGYIVFFPDEGVFKYIGKDAVSKQGLFQIGGRHYELVKMKPEARYTVPHPVSGKPWTVALVAKPA